MFRHKNMCRHTRVRSHTHKYTQAKSNFGINIELINVGRHLQVSIMQAKAWREGGREGGRERAREIGIQDSAQNFQTTDTAQSNRSISEAAIDRYRRRLLLLLKVNYQKSVQRQTGVFHFVIEGSSLFADALLSILSAFKPQDGTRLVASACGCTRTRCFVVYLVPMQ